MFLLPTEFCRINNMSYETRIIKMLVLLAMFVFFMAFLSFTLSAISLEIMVIIILSAIIVFGVMIEIFRLKGQRAKLASMNIVYQPAATAPPIQPLSILPSHYTSMTMPGHYEVENINRIKINR